MSNYKIDVRSALIATVLAFGAGAYSVSGPADTGAQAPPPPPAPAHAALHYGGNK